MSPSSSHKQNRRYTYYVSQAVLQYREEEAGSVIRVSTKIVDERVTDLLLGLLGNADQLLDALRYFNATADTLGRVIAAGKELAASWPDLTLKQRIPIIQQLVGQVVVGRSELTVTLRLEGVYRRLAGEQPPPPPKNKRRPGDLVLKSAVMLKRSGIESKLVYPGGPPATAHKRAVKALQEALLKSLQWNEAILSGEVPSFEALIRRDQLNARQTHRLRKLAFLAPDIMEAIIAGQVPETQSLETLKRDFPVAWDAQRRHFGFR